MKSLLFSVLTLSFASFAHAAELSDFVGKFTCNGENFEVKAVVGDSVVADCNGLTFESGGDVLYFCNANKGLAYTYTKNDVITSGVTTLVDNVLALDLTMTLLGGDAHKINLSATLKDSKDLDLVSIIDGGDKSTCLFKRQN